MSKLGPIGKLEQAIRLCRMVQEMMKANLCVSVVIAAAMAAEEYISTSADEYAEEMKDERTEGV